MIKQSKEDYLRAIYNFWEQKDGNIRSIDVVKHLKLSRASVSEMLKKLADKKYITMKPYSNIYFTKKGLRKAKNLTYKHRVIEVFLKDVLKCNPKKIHLEAHRLEHAFSTKMVKKLDNYLKKPKECPDGKKIPKI